MRNFRFEWIAVGIKRKRFAFARADIADDNFIDIKCHFGSHQFNFQSDLISRILPFLALSTGDTITRTRDKLCRFCNTSKTRSSRLTPLPAAPSKGVNLDGNNEVYFMPDPRIPRVKVIMVLYQKHLCETQRQDDEQKRKIAVLINRRGLDEECRRRLHGHRLIYMLQKAQEDASQIYHPIITKVCET